MEDPLSPFHPSQPSDSSAASSSWIKKPLPKTDLAFLNKVTDVNSDTLYWNKDMGVKNLSSSSSSSESTKKALHAFRDAGRRVRMKEEISRFCLNTSFTPLTLIHNASSWLRRIGWVIVFLTMLVWLSVQCFWLLEKYFSYPMEVKLNLQAAKVLAFPSVTICNLNPVKISALYNPNNTAFAAVVHYADGINDDDMLYDAYYDYRYDSYYTTTPYMQGPHVGGANGQGSTTPWMETAQTAGARKKRDVSGTGITNNPTSNQNGGTGSKKNPTSNQNGGTGSNTNPTSNQNAGTAGDNPVSSYNSEPSKPHDISFQKNLGSDSESLDDNIDNSYDYPLEFGENPDWVPAVDDLEALEDDVFGENGRSAHRRYRRSEEEDRKDEMQEMMMQNSFNKWDTLSNNNVNTSYYGTRGTGYKASMAYATISAQMDEQEVRASGHALNDLLISCSFNGWLCSPSNFSYFHSHKFGNCYTFNGADSPKAAETKFPGPDFGLTLEMFIQQDEYVPALAAEAGVRVLIHPRGSTPFPEDEGISIAPTLSTSISMRMGEVIRLEPPHGTCNHQGSGTDLYASRLGTFYSKHACLKSCYQNIAKAHCNCSLPMYIVPSGSPVCNMTDDVVDQCTSSLPERVPAEYSQCDKQCPQSCYEVDYDMLVSTAAWPSQHYQNYLRSTIRQSSYMFMGDDDKIKDHDFVKLNVYYTDLMYQKIEQQKGYESQNLISDIGGQLGLWLGLSAITIGELCGLILALFRSVTSVGPDSSSSSSAGCDSKRNSTGCSKTSSDLRLSELEDDVMRVHDVKARGYV